MNITLTLIGQTLTFLVFVWFCHAFVWPPLVAAMRERQKAIADGLAASERAEDALKEARANAARELQAAKEEAARILESARARGNQMVEEAQALAREEGERLKASARAEIEQEVNRAKEALRGQVAALAVTGAERILRGSVDARRHAQMLEQLAAGL
jgi:F-type H+-transporting ATPase subunit b